MKHISFIWSLSLILLAGIIGAFIWQAYSNPFTIRSIDINILKIKEAVGSTLLTQIIYYIAEVLRILLSILLAVFIPITVISFSITINRYLASVIIGVVFILCVHISSLGLVGHSYFEIAAHYPLEVWIPIYMLLIILACAGTAFALERIKCITK